MILLTWSMIRARAGQALTVLVMAAVAVGAAVASGVYVDAAQRRIVADDVAAAPAIARSIIVTEPARLKAAPDNAAQQAQVTTTAQRAFEKKGPALVRSAGFTTVFSARYDAFVSNRPFQASDGRNGAVEFRQRFCDHVVLVRGRCVSGPGEALVSRARAAAGLGLSETVVTTPLQLVNDRLDGTNGSFRPTDRPTGLVVVGVYQPRDPAEPYWGTTALDFLTTGSEPVLTDRLTLTSIAHPEEIQSIVAYAGPDTFAFDRITAIRDDVSRVLEATVNFSRSTDVFNLLTTIERDSRTVALVAGVAAVPLVALCWYVLFLAIAFAVQARRTELGMVKLRGVSSPDQWWITAAESLVPLFVGAAFGYLLGHLAVSAYARAAFGPSIPVPVTSRPLPYAVVALAGAVLAGLFAIRRHLASTATELLRRVPTLRHGRRGLSVAVLVSAIAALAVVQLRSVPPAEVAESQSGLGRFAPALLIIALGLLCAVLVDPIMGRIGSRALRRGRLDVALAGLHIGRRRSGSRLLALVMVAVSLLTFATTAGAYAGDERARQAGVQVGADQVLAVSAKDAGALLTAVRSVDPAGDYAMAVLPVYTGSISRQLLAVDSPRLPHVAAWPDGNDSTTAQAAAALHPTLAEPIEVRGTGLAVSATRPAGAATFPVGLRATVAQVDTGLVVGYDLTGPASPGAPYTTHVACAAGCRLVDLRFVAAREGPPASSRGGAPDPQLTLASVRQTGPERELVSGADLARWHNRSPTALRTEATDTGLRVTVGTLPEDRGLVLVPPDTPADLPMLDAGGSYETTLQVQGAQVITTKVAATAQVLPRLGRQGAFTDLEYLLRTINAAPDSSGAEVWLGPSAPAGTAQRLTAAGLTIRSTARLSDQVAAAEQSPSAVGLRFLLIVALFSVLLGAAGLVVAAGVERRTRAEELRALRIQGLPSALATRVALLGYVVLVGVAALLGLASGSVAWYATGAFLPVVATPGPALSLLPGGEAIVAAALGGGILIVVAAAIASLLARSSHPGGAGRTERSTS